MRLLRIQTEAFRGLPNRTYDFAHPGTGAPQDVVIITGEPGSGKTSLLEAIVAAKEDVGPYGPTRALGSCVRAGARTARVHATWVLSPAERARAGLGDAVVTTTSVFGDGEPPVAPHPDKLRALFAEHSCAPGKGKVEYFHAGRSLAAGRGVSSGTDTAAPAAEVRLRLTTSNEKYRAVRAYLVAACLADAAKAAETLLASGVVLGAGSLPHRAEIQQALRPLLRDRTFEGIEPAARGYRLRFRCRSGELLDLDDLSATEQQAVLFAATFRHLGLEHSLVLIDEPELHVHAAHRVRFLQAVVGLGRDNQIVAATGAAELVSAALPAQVLDLSRPAATPLRAAG
jgi:hypothetical protein